ncbi:MAG: HAD family hydrolase [Candidatus Saganbacteria bacterium]|nr:HAD family hydrolase [Candidatus Saganbacteria bacterium]
MVSIGINDKILEDIQLVIFDRDGTMIDLYHYWSQMIKMRSVMICNELGLSDNHKNNLMSVMGIDVEKKKIKPEGPVGIKKREVVMQAAVDYLLSIKMGNKNDFCIKVFSEVDKISQDEVAKLISPIEGLYPLLEGLKSSGCKIAIATTDRTGRAELSVKFLKINDKIDFVIGSDGVECSKPAPDMINLILKKLNIDKTNTIMVGDAASDIKMGINAGVKAGIAVCSGITPEKKLSELTPLVIKDISEIKIY